MSELPMKYYWRGQDMEELSRDELMGVVKHLATELEQTRAHLTATCDIFRAANARRRAA